ncbi:hypothetical protein ACIQXI_04485 [Lysinibacillus sp. NPDC097195]|uniref:hypothetical protein n=1 Tax=Lysinibacillus sp. NPDC097195 TaxID=3364141 RepID=UPI00381997F2
MDPIRNAINSVYKEGKFSLDNQQKTFQKIHQQKKRPLTPVILTLCVTICLIIGLNMLLMNNKQPSPETPLQGSEHYLEKSGKVKDYTVLLNEPWMMIGLITIVLLCCFGLYALRKKSLWWLLLCAIVIFAIVGNMSERLGYRYYVANEDDIVDVIQSGVWLIGNTDDLQLFDTITIDQFRLSYFTTSNMQGIAFFKHDGKGYKLVNGFLNSEATMQTIVLPEIHYIVVPLLEGHTIERIIVDMNTEQIEVAVDAHRGAQLVAVPFPPNAHVSSATIQAVRQDGTVEDLYQPSEMFVLPDVD